jgi:hypothetical protein
MWKIEANYAPRAFRSEEIRQASFRLRQPAKMISVNAAGNGDALDTEIVRID